LKELAQNATLEVRPGFVVEFSAVSPVSEKILEEAERLRVDVIIMGLHPSTHIGTASHMPLATAYEVVCGAGCPVLTVRR
jgi:nucleotide-binding universal stress UspA family protein